MTTLPAPTDDPEYNHVDIQWWVNEIINDTETRVFAVTAGLGSGKTHGLCQAHYHLTCENEGSPFSAFMMPIYQKIFDAAIPTFQKVFSQIGFTEGVEYKIIKSPYPKLVYPETKQEVHFISANRPESIVAVEYSHAGVSEAGAIKYDAFQLLRTRIRDKRAKRRQTILEGVTQGVDNWYAELFDFNPETGWVEFAKRDYVNIERRFRRFRLTTYDNQKYLPDDYIANLLDIYRNQPNYIQAWIFGFFVALIEGNVYSNYNPALHDIKDIEPSPFLDVDLTFDFNATPMSWLAIQEVPYIEAGNRYVRDVAVHEISDGISQLDDSIVDFSQKFPVAEFAQTQINVYGDSTGHHQSHKRGVSDYEFIKTYLNQLGYMNVEIHALKYNPKETASVEALNSLFLNDLHYVCKRCYKYKRSLAGTRWQEGLRKIDKPPGETITHMGDASKYRAFVKAVGSNYGVKNSNVR